jgi:hypothetical protein
MRTAPRALRDAVAALRAEFTVRDQPGDADDWAAAAGRLEELESRVCRAVPAQGPGPTADEVTAAILTHPEIARAAAAALASTSA